MRLIDRDKVVEYINTSFTYRNTAFIDKFKLLAKIKNAPTIDAEPIRHGKWNIVEGMPTQCSLCGYYVKQKTYKYCPYCGARMENDD